MSPKLYFDLHELTLTVINICIAESSSESIVTNTSEVVETILTNTIVTQRG